jgi:hypothetical protein
MIEFSSLNPISSWTSRSWGKGKKISLLALRFAYPSQSNWLLNRRQLGIAKKLLAFLDSRTLASQVRRAQNCIPKES